MLLGMNHQPSVSPAPRVTLPQHSDGSKQSFISIFYSSKISSDFKASTLMQKILNLKDI